MDGTDGNGQALGAVAAPGNAEAPPGESMLWSRWRVARDEAARVQLLDRYLPYARVVAASYYARRMHNEIEFDEYLQLARLGMLESFDRYDPAAGAQFKTFAARRMHGAILDGLEQLTEKQRQIGVRKRLQADRLESLKTRDVDAPDSVDPGLFQRLADVGIGLALGILLEETGMFADEGDARNLPQTPYQPLEVRQTQRRLRELVDRLPDSQRRVIRDHYIQNQPFDEIAKELGLSKGRVSQIHKQALGSLRQLIGARQRCDVDF